MSSTRPRLLAAGALLALCPLSAADTLFVDANLGTGNDDGSSWADAFQGSDGLQAAILASAPGDEIWVADGVYLPSATGAQGASFRPQSGVSIFGSFAGGESSVGERPPFGSSDSVLSGDLNGDDGSGLLGDNSFHVLNANGADATALVDGFLITGGVATTSGSNRDRGGGLLNVGTWAPRFANCRFVGNRSSFGGGAVYVNNGGGPWFTDCAFEDNLGGSFGGAFDCAGATGVRYERCLFRGNSAARAGALEFFASTGIEVNACVFVDNEATGNGGGGAVWVGGNGSARLRSCTVVGNRATTNAVGGVLNASTNNFRIFNTILWANEGPGGVTGSANQVAAGTLVFNSLVQGGFAGGTNIVSGDPLFVDAPALDFTPGPGSPAIDAGDTPQVFPGTTIDYAGHPRFADVLSVADTGIGGPPVVDIGAYEVRSAFADLGNALAGTLGAPALALDGTLDPDSANVLELSGAAPSATAFLVVGFSAVNAPLKGGVLVPAADIVKGIPTTAGGTRTIPFTWPTNLPSGFESFYQYWIADAGGPAGFAASNGVGGVTP